MVILRRDYQLSSVVIGFTGAGSAVAEALAAAGVVMPVLQLGLPDKFIDHGDAQQLLAQCGLDAAGIIASVRQRLGQGATRLVVNNQ